MGDTHVTEREQAEEPGRAVLDSIPVQIWSGPPDGTLDYCNRPWRAYTGLSLEELQGHGWQRMLHPDDKDRVLKALQESVANGTPYEREERHRRADGVYRWFLCRGLPLKDAAGRVVRWYGANTDIEDRKRAEEALRQSERRLNEAERIAHIGHWEHDLEARRLTASAEACRIFGSPPQESLQVWAAWQEPLDPKDLGILSAAIERLLREGPRYEAEYRVVRPDGEVRTVHSRGEVERDAAGRPRRLFGVVQDITERKRVEEALRRSEELLRRTEAMAHVAGWTLTLADGEVTASEEGQRLFGWAPGPRRLEDLMALVHPDDRPRVEAAMQAALAGTPFETEHRIVVGGQVKWVRRRVEPESDPAGRVVRLVGVSQDVTERRKLEEQFRQAHKMEAIGTLAGGVAHDFNNLLTIINGCSDLLLGSLRPGDPMWNLLAEIHKAGERAGALTRQLLMFSRQQVVEPKVLDLNAVVADTEKMLRRLLGEDIVLTRPWTRPSPR